VDPAAFYGFSYLQDDSAGIRLVLPDESDMALAVGETWLVTGTLEFNSYRQAIVNAEQMVLVEDAPATDPGVTTVATGEAVDNWGRLVQTEGTVVATTWYWGDDYLTITDNEDFAKDTLMVMLFGSTGIDFGLGANINGETVCVTGIAESTWMPQGWVTVLLPRSNDDLWMGTCEGGM
ncbi:MAG: hypothetical protein ACRC1H_18940, partial [Caldilineaceae bacterium]